MATVFDVANWFLSKETMEHKKLQKLCYYAYACSLVLHYNKPMFECDFEAWVHGPVCPKLFALHKGVYSIKPSSNVWDKANPDVLTEGERETVDAVIRDYGDKKGHWLRELTHLEDPWKNARGGIPLMEPCN